NYLVATIEEEGANNGTQIHYTSKHLLGCDETYAFYGIDTTLSVLYFIDSYTDNDNTSAEVASGSKGKVPTYMVLNFNLG
ncbi:TonB-dependent siderophore receptor, partial [Vibrio parahaemolyticus]|nr:TonB-dependent siderophore receptor [Vibrio parahaemolyticus]